jgi:hypothetical protein
MNPLAKIIRHRKNKDKAAKQPQTIEQQPPEAPRPLDESELKLVGGGGDGSSKATTNDGGGVSSPRGSW